MAEDRNATIVHAVPGRVRVRLDKASRSLESMRELAESVTGIGGVRRVETNPITGSLLILYDPETTSLEEVYLAARALNINVTLPEMGSTTLAGDQPSEVAQTINSAFGRVDRAVAGITGGTLDLKTLVPLGLGAVAVRQIVATGGHLTAAPWYTLLWYSFGVFTRYNLKKDARAKAEVGGE